MKQGFTLIELLAVIVILAIIALIAVPIVLNIIEDSNKKAAEASMENIEAAAKLYYASKQTKNEITEDIIFTCDGSKCSYGNEILEIDGKVPERGTITINSAGNITYKNIILKDYYCYKENGFTCSKNYNKNYIIYGNSIQDGVIIPDNLIEIESVGDKTKNLLDKNNVNRIPVISDSAVFSYVNAGVIEDSNSAQYELDNSRTLYIECKSNTTYTISKNQVSRFRIGTTQNLPKIKDRLNDYKNSASKSITITTNNTARYLVIQLYINSNYNATTLNWNTMKDNLQIEEGDVSTFYEPYGYKVPITIDGNDYNIYIDEQLKCNEFSCDYMDVKGKKVYRTDGNIEEVSAYKIEKDGTVNKVDNIQINKNSEMTVSTAIKPSKIDSIYYK